MPRGGKRIGAGRKKGSRTKRTQAVIDGVLAEGIAPLAYMLSVMRDPNAEAHRRDQMAVAAAPFIHPRLSTVNATVGGSVKSVTTVNIVSVPHDRFLSSDQIRALELNNELLPAPKVDPVIQHLWDLDHSARNLIDPPVAEPLPTQDQEFKPQTERERRLLAELEALSQEELLERARQAGYVDDDSIQTGKIFR